MSHIRLTLLTLKSVVLMLKVKKFWKRLYVNFVEMTKTKSFLLLQVVGLYPHYDLLD